MDSQTNYKSGVSNAMDSQTNYKFGVSNATQPWISKRIYNTTEQPILYKRYGKILFQKVGPGYALPLLLYAFPPNSLNYLICTQIQNSYNPEIVVYVQYVWNPFRADL